MEETLTTTAASNEPLLDKPTIDPLIAAEEPNQYLQISYNYGRRRIKDLPFLLLFCVLVVCSFSFGIFASVKANPHRFQISSFIYNATSSTCSFVEDVPVLTSSWPHFPASLNSERSFWEISVFTLLITLALSAPFGLFLLFLLKHYTKQIVYASLPFFLIVPILVNVYWFVACTLSSRCNVAFPLSYRIVVLVFVFLLISVITWIFVVNWHRIELTVRIIGVASNALSRNLGLLAVLPALTLGLLVYYVPFILFLIFASRNGKIVAAKESGDGGYYCAWKQDGWVPAYYALVILTMLWSATALIEAQIYVISGTIAQWYFSMEDSRPQRGMRGSLRSVFGPSFGTVCFSGLLIFVVRAVRFVVDKASEEDGSGFVKFILRCCANALLSTVDFLNKFTINFAAITGEAYCKSSRMSYELLKRNLLSAVFVETISTRILSGVILVLSSVYGIAVCAILKGAMNLGDEAYFVGVMAWFVLLLILGFLVHLLDNVIDTVYICYAIDRDKGEVYKQDVHEVYVHIPITRNNRAGFVP